MGCASTKSHQGNCLNPVHGEPLPTKVKDLARKREDFHDQYDKLLNRISDYQKESESCEYLDNLYPKPQSLLPEDLRYGYISANSFFNLFHAGFCAPYISNPNYMLLVDFRSRHEYDAGHILTATHFETLSWEMIEYPDMCAYSLIVFYDQDGTSAANVYSTLHKAFKAMKMKQIEGLCILGGIKSVEERFPYLISEQVGRSVRNSVERSVIIPWMPTLIRTDRLFLGRHEQAEERSVVDGLRLTHILSIGRSPESRFEGIFYFGLDGEKNLMETFDASFTIMNSVINQNGRILVHGVDGLNRSAAVIIAYLMKSTPCILEDAYFYAQVLRPFIKLDDECMECLLKTEKLLFGSHVTNPEELWL